MPMLTRRSFLIVVGAATLTARRRPPDRHPTPRPGIDASKILPAERLQDHPDAIPVFQQARRIPEVLDGIRCQCGCSDLPGKYSLLSCFEEDGMASQCDTCQGQTRLAYRMHRAGRTLDAIRTAIEEKFG